MGLWLEVRRLCHGIWPSEAERLACGLPRSGDIDPVWVQVETEKDNTVARLRILGGEVIATIDYGGGALGSGRPSHEDIAQDVLMRSPPLLRQLGDTSHVKLHLSRDPERERERESVCVCVV